MNIDNIRVWEFLLFILGVCGAFCYGLFVGAKKMFPYYHIDKIKNRFDDSYPTDIKYSHSVINQLDPNSEFDVHFIHVNRNCHATLLRVEGGSTVMIGCGPLTESDVVRGYLSKLGVDSVDKLIIPYYDRDFVAGLKPLLRDISVDEFVLESRTNTVNKKEKVEAIIKNETVVYPDVGEKIELSDNISLKKLSPAKTFDSDNTATAGPNRCNSSIYKLSIPKFDVLIMGDAQIPAENELLDSEFNLSADVLKIGHHGHGPVNSLDFLDAVDPSVAIIDNAWPRERRDDKVLECKSKLTYVDNLDLYETNECGSIVIERSKKESELKTSILQKKKSSINPTKI